MEFEEKGISIKNWDKSFGKDFHLTYLLLLQNQPVNPLFNVIFYDEDLRNKLMKIIARRKTTQERWNARVLRNKISSQIEYNHNIKNKLRKM